MEKITATLENIRYQNEEGFVIAGFAEGGLVPFTALGNMLNPQPNMDYTLFGKWMTNKKWGRQFQFSRYETIQPRDEDGIYRYLVRTVRFVGPSIAEDLLEKYGERTLEVLRTDPLDVAKSIKGITLQRAENIQQELVEMEADEAVMVELLQILDIPGLRKSLPYDLMNDYGSDAATRLKENPYIIMDYHGTGFLMADSLALHSCGIDPDSEFRARAAVVWAIKQGMQEGNTWVSNEFIDIRIIEVGIRQAVAGATITDMIDDEQLVAWSNGNGMAWFALPEVDRDESLIAERIRYAVERKAANSLQHGDI